jgi:hypothetical protein
VRIRLWVLKNSFRICPRINDLALTFTWTSLLDWRLGDILFFLPVGFSLLSCLSFDILELLHQRALVVELMDMSRCEIKQPLVRPDLVVGLDVTAQFFRGRYLIGIISHQINLFLLYRPRPRQLDPVPHPSAHTYFAARSFLLPRSSSSGSNSIVPLPHCPTPRRPCAPDPCALDQLHHRLFLNRHSRRLSLNPSSSLF